VTNLDDLEFFKNASSGDSSDVRLHVFTHLDRSKQSAHVLSGVSMCFIEGAAEAAVDDVVGDQ
jgi:hypothetical protein